MWNMRLWGMLYLSCVIGLGANEEVLHLDHDYGEVDLDANKHQTDIEHTFTVNGGTIIDGKVRRKGPWNWHGTNNPAKYSGIVPEGEDATKGHGGYFSGKYTMDGNGGGENCAFMGWGIIWNCGKTLEINECQYASHTSRFSVTIAFY